MALVVYRPYIGSLRGRVGTDDDVLVYYNLGGRGVCRSVVTKKSPATAAQTVVRRVHARLSERFTQLTRAHVEAWNAFAANFTRYDASGNPYALSGFHAYQATNTHRILAGKEPVDDPPRYEFVPVPSRLESVAVEASGRLQLVLHHVVGAGSGFWRIRLTPPLATRVRLAEPRHLRWATEKPSDSYLAIAPSPQTVVLTPARPYPPGCTLGVEILSLSRDYVPGGTLFVRWVTAEAGP